MLTNVTINQILIAIILVILGFVLGVSTADSLFPRSNNENNLNTEQIQTIESNGFTLVAKYIKNNDWEYTVTGVLPNKCVRYDLTEVVAESLPEQATITLAVSEPEDDTLCAQVLQTVKESGVFVASPEATVAFEYAEVTNRPSATGLKTKNEN